MRKPRSPSDWDLYDNIAGAEVAAEALTAAVDAALASLDKINLHQLTEGERSRLLAQLMTTYMEPVMNRHAAVGAADTETRNLAFAYLRAAIQAKRVLQ